MRLRSKTALYFLMIVGGLMLVAGALAYTAIQGVVREEVDEGLWRNWKLVEPLVMASEHPEGLSAPNLEVEGLAALPRGRPSHAFRDTLLPDGDDAVEDWEQFRVLEMNMMAGNGPFRVRLYASSVDGEDLENAILWTFGIVGGLFLIAVLLFQFVVSARLWRPFDRLLGAVESFELTGGEMERVATGNTLEFQQLADFLEKMTRKVQQDYQHLKRFSENASHELQTPLAVLRAKLERLLQSEGLSQGEMTLLGDALEAVQRLSRLQAGLLLLSKIENRQFPVGESLPLRTALEREIELQKDRLDLKGLHLDVVWEADPSLHLHPVLLEVLLGNLLSNAIRHNVLGGRVMVRCDAVRLLICNTGKESTLDSNLVFERFGKGGGGGKSAGLGLAIAREICQQANWTLDYRFEDGLHCFQLTFG